LFSITHREVISSITIQIRNGAQSFLSTIATFRKELCSLSCDKRDSQGMTSSNFFNEVELTGKEANHESVMLVFPTFIAPAKRKSAHSKLALDFPQTLRYKQYSCGCGESTALQSHRHVAI